MLHYQNYHYKLSVQLLTQITVAIIQGTNVVHDGAAVTVHQQQRARLSARPHAQVAAPLPDDGAQQDRCRLGPFSDRRSFLPSLLPSFLVDFSHIFLPNTGIPLRSRGTG